MVAWLGAAAGALGSILGGRSQASAARAQAETQERIYKRTRKDNEPFRLAGTGGINALSFELGLGAQPEGYTPYEMSDYERFVTDQGTRAVEASAAARGRLGSGATMLAVQDRGQQTAGGFRENFLNRLTNIAGIGQAAASAQASAGQNYAQGMGQVNSAIGNANAGAFVGAANAFNTGLQNQQALNAYNDWMNRQPNYGGVTGR